jgi:hypothetical protein
MMIGGSADGCPLLGVNQTSLLHRGIDAIDPYATSAEAAYSAGRGYLIADELRGDLLMQVRQTVPTLATPNHNSAKLLAAFS